MKNKPVMINGKTNPEVLIMLRAKRLNAIRKDNKYSLTKSYKQLIKYENTDEA